MPNAANVNVNIINHTNNVSTPSTGVVFVMGETLRGSINDPKDLITSWKQFVTLFGGYLSNSDFPLLCERMLNRGATLRVARMAHYTTPSNASTLTAVKSTTVSILDAATNVLFKLIPKWAGVDFDNVGYEITAASNGSSDYFNLLITHALEPSLNETYENLQIPKPYPNKANSTFLASVVNGSTLVDIEYQNLDQLQYSGSGTVPYLIPVNVSGTFTGGSDGGVIVDADYAGNSASGIGFYAFDKYNESYAIAAPDKSSNAIHIAGEAYATIRKDLRYYGHLDNSNTSTTSLKAARNATNINSKYARFYAGGLIISDPVTGIAKHISELGDVLGCMVVTQIGFKPWYSFAGPQRGIIPNVLGVINNFGSPAQYADLNTLANAQINMVISRNNTIMLWGNFSAQLADNIEKFNNVNDLEIYLVKSLTPTLEGFLEEPCDFPLFNLIYYTVKPFNDDVVTNRGMYKYEWLGDQFATSFSQLQVNTANDMAVGKYKIVYRIWPTPSLQSITLNISLEQGVGIQIVPGI
jgi:hypothetical protein